MPEMFRVTINWTGFTGGPGYSNLYFETSDGGAITQGAVDSAVTKVAAFLAAIRGELPSSVTTGVEAQVQEIAEITGNLEALWTGTPPAAAPGTDAGVYSGATGFVINWFTNEVINNRRVRGRTFIVPLGGSAYDLNGTIGTTRLATFNTAATNLRADSGNSRLVVWHRPNPVTGLGGGAYQVVSHRIPDKAAVLTSRRD